VSWKKTNQVSNVSWKRQIGKVDNVGSVEGKVDKVVWVGGSWVQ